MNTRTALALAAAALAGVTALSGCAGGGTGEAAAPASPTGQPTTAHEQTPADEQATGGHHDHGDHPADGGPVPAGMTEAAAPTYPAGTKVTLKADHMPGMDGAPATVVGAYDTFTYSINYTPTNGGHPVQDHRWVVQEELRDAGDQRLADGTEVTVQANHMHGMDGATATIARSTDETVYVVDFEADGMAMTNHKWVVESEIQPAS